MYAGAAFAVSVSRRRSLGVPVPSPCHCATHAVYWRRVAAFLLADCDAARIAGNRGCGSILSRRLLLLRSARLRDDQRRTKYLGMDHGGQRLESSSLQRQTIPDLVAGAW